MKKQELFGKIAGYDCVKSELIKIYNWYTDKKIATNNKVELPKGILLFGHPGNGKSLFVKEYIEAMGCPSFDLLGKSKNIREEIHNCFARATKEKISIIVIDEIDKFVRGNPMALKVLQSEMDAVPSGKVIILATTNNYVDLPDSITRQGRFDRKILVAEPEKDDIIEVFKFYLNRLGVNCTNIDLDHIARITRGISCAEIKSVCNDAYLEAKDNMTTCDIEAAYDRMDVIDYRNLKPITYKNYHVAIHEAGHAIMAMRFSKDVRLYTSKFTSTGGQTIHYVINEVDDTIEKRFERIQIALSGALAEKIFFKKHDIGSVSDFDKAFHLTSNLIDKTCYSGLKHFVGRPERAGDRPDTEEHHLINEKLVWKTLKKQKRYAYRYLKSQKQNIKKFADYLYEKGQVSFHDVESIFKNGEVKETPIKKYMLPKYASYNKED